MWQKLRLVVPGLYIRCLPAVDAGRRLAACHVIPGLVIHRGHEYSDLGWSDAIFSW